ncbi:MAG TPA: hypothetical protein VJ895_01300 [Candidatus Nanoarchaeia archaeon]|nr:hypothetical protein [Candidatus Nanoarchaeia archaeon]
MEQITGQQITNIRPLGTQYHNGCVAVFDDKENRYLMKVSEILKFNTDFNGLVFNIIEKKIHKYLEVVEEDK